MIPTVRVAHPRDPSIFMTINADTYRQAVHGDLWPEQAPGFTGLPAPKPQHMDPAVRDLAAALMVRVMDADSVRRGRDVFSSLSPAAQIEALRVAQKDIEDSEERYKRANQISDEDRRARDYAAEAEAARLRTIEVERAAAEAATQTPPAAMAPATSQAEFERSAGQAAAEAPPPPVPGAEAPAPGTPSWANPPTTAPVAPVAEALTVSKGPGNKWYVMRGNTPVTEGIGTKAEAETKMAAINAGEGE